MAKAQKPITDRTAQISRALRHAIMEQALSPGAKLPEDAIGERFGASRTIVRYALGQLAAEGLVELRSNRGAVVATPSGEEARDIFDIRLGLERLVMARLAGRLDKAPIAQLQEHVEDEERARGENEPLSIRLATQFHIVLANMTGSESIARYVSEVSSLFGLILALYSRPHSSECAVSEHRAVIDALVSGDADAAMKVMEGHLEAVANRALIMPSIRRNRELSDILDSYAGETAPARASTAKKKSSGH